MRGRNWIALTVLMAVNLVFGVVAMIAGSLVAASIATLAKGDALEVGGLDGALELATRCCREVVDAARSLYPDDLESSIELLVVVVAVTGPALIAAPALRSEAPHPKGRSLRASVAGAAALGGACVIGVLATAWDALGLAVTAAPEEPGQWLRGGSMVMVPFVLVPAWIAAGFGWAVLIRRAGTARQPDGLDRMVRRIFAGTCVELAIAAPTLVVATRRDECSCSWGSWWAIVAGITSLGLLCGPAIVLLATRKARMQWMRGVCMDCGYPLRGGSAVCPECGKSVPG